MEKDIRYFGVDVVETFYKNGNFKSFLKKNWIKTNKKIFVDYKISDIRSSVEKVVLIKKQEHLKRKKDKIVKAISKTYEVVEKGTKHIPSHDFNILLDCNLRKTLFSYKNIVFYYIMNNIYRDTETNIYYYIDEGKHKLIDTGYSLENKPTKEDILNYIKNYS